MEQGCKILQNCCDLFSDRPVSKSSLNTLLLFCFIVITILLSFSNFVSSIALLFSRENKTVEISNTLLPPPQFDQVLQNPEPKKCHLVVLT